MGAIGNPIRESPDFVMISLNETCCMQVVVTLGLVYNVQQFSSVMFQVVADVKRKKKSVMDVLAAGGRYDALVSYTFLFSCRSQYWHRIHAYWFGMLSRGFRVKNTSQRATREKPDLLHFDCRSKFCRWKDCAAALAP